MDIRTVARHYASPDDGRAWQEVGTTVVLYVLALVLALASIGTWWLLLPLIPVVAALGVRCYVILHDCMHRSFFASRAANDAVGTLLSPIAMTPYKATRHIHNLHHSHVSDLDRRDTFEIHVMTLREWQAASPWHRLRYRLYRTPVTLILVGPFLLYTLVRRVPPGGLQTGIGDLVLHNLLVAGMIGSIWLAAGWPGVAVWAAAVWCACILGALISYVVHNFETIHWGVKPGLTHEVAALEGASVLDWGRLFHLVTMNIGYHDLHHLNARIPGYKLRRAHGDLEERGLIHSNKIGFVDGLRCLRWKLYDEDGERMITFPATRAPGLMQTVP